MANSKAEQTKRNKAEAVPGPPPKIREFSLICYDNPKDWFFKIANVAHYAYIRHDKDKKLDGSPKEPHYHLVFTVRNPRTLSGMLSECQKLATQNVLGEAVNHELANAYLYLTHESANCRPDDPYKPRYPREAVYTDDVSFWESKKAELARHEANVNLNEQFIRDLLSPNYGKLEMALKYGRDYIKNWETYERFAMTVINDYSTPVRDPETEIITSYFEDSCIDTAIETIQR